MLTVRWLIVALIAAVLCAAVLRRLARAPASPTPWRLALGRLRRNRSAMAALCVIITLYLVAIFAPLLAPYEPWAQPDITRLMNQPPSRAHWFGTDPYSRDVFSRMLHGARVSLSVALLSVMIAVTVGTAYGAVAGFAGGRVDSALMRINDALLSIPRILLLIAVLSFWGSIPLSALVIFLGLTGWFGVSRLVRAQVRAVAGEEFVMAARALGAPRARILLRHVMPNAISPVIVAATLGIGNVIILEAGLSYLGIGVPQPHASWGSIIQDGAARIASHWWVTLFPGLAIVLTVMAFNVIGDGLRDALDPRQVERA